MLVAYANYSPVPLNELLTLPALQPLLPKDSTGKPPTLSTLYEAVKAGRVPAVKVLGRLHSHPQWVVEASLQQTAGAPLPSARKREIARAEAEADRRLGR